MNNNIVVKKGNWLMLINHKRESKILSPIKG